jgi:hypothetical protein
MANKTLREFSTPSTENIRTGPTLNNDNLEFKLKPSLINMVQATLFSGKAHEDACAHLQNFLDTSSTVVIKNIAQDIILIHLSHCHLWEERRSGSTPTKITSIHGQDVRRPS